MSKKDFKSNPALQFITQPTQGTDNTHNTDNTHEADIERMKAAAAKRKKPETKSKRLNLLLQPSTMDALTKIAYMNRSSVNDLINSILKQYTTDHADQVQKYDSIFSGQEGEQ